MSNYKPNQEILSAWKNQIEMSPSSIFSKQDVLNVLDSIFKALSLVEGEEEITGNGESFASITNEAMNNFKVETIKGLAELIDKGKYHDELMDFSQIVYSIEPGSVITVKDGVIIDLEKFDGFLETIKTHCLNPTVSPTDNE
jgi:hypothetical protein